MRRVLPLAALLLPLCGCYVPATDAGYGYAQPGYPPPAGYGYPPPTDAYGNAYPGYSEYNGVPSMMEGGAAMPLVMFGGEWGFYDSGRRWHRAPEGISRHMEEHRGGDFHPNGAPHGQEFGQPRQEGHPGGGRFGGQAAFRPAEPPRAAAPQGAPAGQPRPEQREHHRDCPPGQHC